MKYQNIYPKVQNFFRKKGIAINSQISSDVVLCPFGERCGPDIMLITLVGEIKDAKEIREHLNGYWSQWDNENTSMGGSGYKISNDFHTNNINQLDSSVKGWIAVIYGQLRHYCKPVNLTDGWLIVEYQENTSSNENSNNDFMDKINKLKVALDFLKEEGKIRDYIEEICDNLKIYHIIYSEI